MNTLQRIAQLKAEIELTELYRETATTEKAKIVFDKKIDDLHCQLDCHIEHCN